MTPEELEALDALAAPGRPAAPAASPPDASGGMTPEQLEALDAATATAPPAVTPQTPAPTPLGSQAAPTANGNPLSPAGQIGGAIVTGAAKSIYETKDFIFGKPEDGQKSDLRRGIEALDRDLGNASIANSFVSGLSQFATGMLGAGKLVSAAKAVPAVGGAVGALEAGRKGSIALSSGKAAAVGAVAFDPNGPRLSDLVQKFPALQNPVSEFLASQPGDSAALGRAKNALESIGVDVALAGVFAASVAGFKALKSGDAAAIQATNQELAAAVAHKDAKLAAAKGDLETLEALRQDHPQAAAAAEASLPVAPAEVPVQPKDVAQQAAQATQQADPPAPAVDVRKVDSPTQGAGPAGLPPKPDLLGVSDEQLTRFIAEGQADTAAILGPGGWEGAVERGYKFGDGGSIPWQKLMRVSETGLGSQAAPDPFDFMLARVADQFKPELDKLKGGVDGVMSDPMVVRLRDQRVALFGEDPQAFMGALQVAASHARTMVANMEAAQLLAQRAMLDTLNLRSRIGLGMLEEFGGDMKAARAALEDHLSVSATLWGHAETMNAAAGRALRRNRADFAFTPEDLAAMKSLDDVKFFNVLDAVGHEFGVASKLLKPGFWTRLKDDAAYLYVNNLLWGLRTHFVNLVTNSYMLMGRPAERAIGFAIKGDTAAVKEQWAQYGYMGSSLGDAFRDMVRTWKTGDSILTPHTAEITPEGVAGATGTNWVAEGYKPWTSVPNIISNGFTGFMKAAGLPTRSLGAVDELVKQVVYRSKVQAQALADGIEAGLEGEPLKAHVRQTLLDAFDDAGRGVDLRALDEANIATFQQDLLPGTMGKTVQNIVANHEVMRFVIPFVKTPSNVIRMGVKLTPGLNMLQGEYRDMIRGVMGPEKQAQAMGQMAMGSMFLGTAGFLAASGYVTGGGPSDRNLLARLRETGWQPYSFVVPQADGSRRYVNFGRYDPIAMPFGIVADIVDIAGRDQDGDGYAEKAWEAASGLLVALTKQMGQKSYLTGLHDTLDAIMDPDRNMAKVAGATAANFVPFSSGLRFWNTDPYLREARDVVDKIHAVVPGLSSKLPARRDVFGDPLTVHKGLWVDGDKTAVDAEVRRMVNEGNVMFGPPSPDRSGVDLRDVTMKDGRNAYEVYQELAGHPPKGPSLKATLARIMKTPAYQRAPDGDADTRGTKLAMLTGTLSKYREAAFRRVRADENVRAALGKRDAEARAAYTTKTAPKTNQQSGAEALSRAGSALGVDLSGLLPQQP